MTIITVQSYMYGSSKTIIIDQGREFIKFISKCLLSHKNKP